MVKKFIGIILGLLTYYSISKGNNVQITNVSVSGDTISFAISWENSWRITNQPPFNWDAVWIIVKRKDCASSNGWIHVLLSDTPSHHVISSPLTVTTVKDRMGVFLHRANDGTGNISNVPVKLKMMGVPPGIYDFKVIGIEMVYIPPDTFWVGDASSTYHFLKVGAGTPFLISSEGAITISNSNGNLWANASGRITGQTLPAYSAPGTGFPKGISPMYVMKYEITQGQYVDFLNSIASDQAAVRGFTVNVNRVNISGSWPNYTTNFPHRAMAFLSWDDLLAYLDWTALAPMTELDFEKICRGPLPPVSNEYAWGTNAIVDANTLINDGTPTETHNIAIPIGSGIANYGNSSALGPVRVGFAAKNSTTRTEAGASYYGVMELSGNVWEQVICFNVNVSSFSGLHGDGEIGTTLSPPVGGANVPGWPTVAGRGIRGGAWDNGASLLRTSDRTNAYNGGWGRVSTIGGRGLRRLY